MGYLPRIIRNNNSFSFLVNEKPFLMLGGELHNSACTSPVYMQNVWKKVEELHCNTILAPVYWELIEPVEKHFDFRMVEHLITGARDHNMKLVLLWFGAWKNGCSSYVPKWIKTDLNRFPRTENEVGIKTKTLSMFQSELLQVETNSFENLMKFIKEFDENNQTILAVQVENEIGVLGAVRDFSFGATQTYREIVPKELIEHLIHNKKSQFHELICNHDENSVQSWESVFKEYSEEAFMSWNYSNYLNHLAKAGKKYYPLPMFTNAWQKEFPNDKPGLFPCGGPLPEMLDIWKFGAPDLDILSPDIYTFDFERDADAYTRKDNPLFIPETRRDKWAVSNLYSAIGKYNALCYSPFGVESIGENKSFITQKIHTDSNDKNVSSEMMKEYLSLSYGMISNMMPIISDYYGTSNMIGFSQHVGQMTDHIRFGNYRISVEYYHQIDDDNEFIPGAGIAIQKSENEFLFMGYGYRANIETVHEGKQLDFLYLEKGTYDGNAVWIPYMILNGDEQHIQMEEKPTVLQAVYYEF